jgi:hypothetical protein
MVDHPAALSGSMGPAPGAGGPPTAASQEVGKAAAANKFEMWACSSAGQSGRLIIGWSMVRVHPGPPESNGPLKAFDVTLAASVDCQSILKQPYCTPSGPGPLRTVDRVLGGHSAVGSCVPWLQS